MKTVLVFGVFDRLHPGHVAFLKGAKALGDQLVVNLAQDDSVMQLKAKTPSETFDERKQNLLDRPEVDAVVNGDTELGTYSAINTVKPDIIAFGYDQQALQEDLTNFLKATGKTIAITTLSPHKPETYKTSLL